MCTVWFGTHIHTLTLEASLYASLVQIPFSKAAGLEGVFILFLFLEGGRVSAQHAQILSNLSENQSAPISYL